MSRDVPCCTSNLTSDSASARPGARVRRFQASARGRLLRLDLDDLDDLAPHMNTGHVWSRLQHHDHSKSFAPIVGGQIDWIIPGAVVTAQGLESSLEAVEKHGRANASQVRPGWPTVASRKEGQRCKTDDRTSEFHGVLRGLNAGARGMVVQTIYRDVPSANRATELVRLPNEHRCAAGPYFHST